MYKNLLLIDQNQIGTVGVYDDESAFRTCQPPLRTYRITAKPSPGHEMYDALVARMEEVDEDSVIPTSVTMRQARLVLLQAGLLDAVTAAVTAAGPAAQIEWEYAQQVDRDWPLVATLASALNLSEAQIDALFAAAWTL